MSRLTWIWPCISGLLALWTFTGCNPPGTLERIRESGKLVVLTRNAPTTYYIGRAGPMGFDYELVAAFAASLGVEVQLEVRDSVAAILEAMARGEGDIAAAGLTHTAKRQARFLFGPDYHTVQQQVVCHRNGKRPERLEELPNLQLLVIAQSSYVERLEELRETLPGLRWDTTAELPTEEILARVWRQEVDCTVADSNIVAINRRYYPELLVAFPLTDEQSLAWVLRPGSTDLQQALQRWFDQDTQDELLKTLRDRYYSHVDLFDYVDLQVYHRHIRERLPRFRPLFERAAQKYGFSWPLIAAVAYQESHWNPQAKSPTGVRGIMMLTQRTANALGIHNRLSPTQSINGGTKYLAQLRRRLPTAVHNPNRLWLALAAYNVGLAHLRDAMSLAARLEKDPHDWHELRQVLPLLAQKKYFKTLKYGYARGTEPVRYVRRIRNYQEILEARLQRLSRTR
jgi:membrane-bound lytic murein transglycosylase F